MPLSVSHDLKILLLPCTTFKIGECVHSCAAPVTKFSRSKSNALCSVTDLADIAPGLTMVDLTEVPSDTSLFSMLD